MPKRFEGPLGEYPETFLECRENHLWQWVNDWKLVRGPRGQLQEFSRLKQCARCKTFIDKKYDGQTGRSLGKNTYRYTEGYLSTDKNPIDPGLARLEQLRRGGFIN